MADKPEVRGSVNCEKDFSVKQKKFDISLDVLKYFKVSLGVSPDDIKDAQGNLG